MTVLIHVRLYNGLPNVLKDAYLILNFIRITLYATVRISLNLWGVI